MSKKRPLIGAIDPAALYDGPDVDHFLGIERTTRWRMEKRGDLEAITLPGVAGKRYRGSQIIELQQGAAA